MAFIDPDRIGYPARRDGRGEEREVVLGVVNYRIIHVVFTMRGDTIRLFQRDPPMQRKGASMKQENIVRARFIDGVMYQEHPDGSLIPLPKGEADWAALAAKTEEQLLEEALSDPDALPLTDEQLAQFERVELKQPVSIRLDEEVLDYFKSSGRGYQTRINAVLKSYVKAQTARRMKRAG
jgi:uncharacterized protein (DUF4415 family)